MKNGITAFCDTGNGDQLILIWGATCVGLTDMRLLLHPANIKPGMTIVAFREPYGYRCDGGGALTSLLLRYYKSVKEVIMK